MLVSICRDFERCWSVLAAAGNLLNRVQSNQWASHAKKVRSKRTVRLHRGASATVRSDQRVEPSLIFIWLEFKQTGLDYTLLAYHGQGGGQWLNCWSLPRTRRHKNREGVGLWPIKYALHTQLVEEDSSEWDRCWSESWLAPLHFSLLTRHHFAPSHKSATPLSHWNSVALEIAAIEPQPLPA
jgi:hypothetical protein